jgi:hypothetical protein
MLVLLVLGKLNLHLSVRGRGFFNLHCRWVKWGIDIGDGLARS